MRSWLILSLMLILPLSASEQVSDFVLEIRDTENSTIAQIPIIDRQWCLHWNHSVTGIAVEDCYRINDRQMLLNHSWQPDFAAGLGHVEGRGELSLHPEGGYLISHIDEPVPNNLLWLRVGSNRVAHTVHTGDTQLNLSALAAGQRVQILLITPQP
ncbi:MAG: DUF1850 domain-containing protein [Nitrincola sp.]|nr:DUF1850 domain-containing protein [Nitrincola sp.]